MGAVFSRSLSVGPISNDHARLDLDCPQFEAWLTAFIAKNLPTVPGALQTQIIEAFKNVNGVSFFKWKLFEIKAKLRNINGLSAVIDIENFARSLFCTFHKGIDESYQALEGGEFDEQIMDKLAKGLLSALAPTYLLGPLWSACPSSARSCANNEDDHDD